MEHAISPQAGSPHATMANTTIAVEQARPVFALLDALRWMTIQQKHGRVTQWKDFPTRFMVERMLSANYFGLTYNKADQLVLVARDMPALQWHIRLPWEGIIIRPKAGTCSLLCSMIDFPACGAIDFKGGKIPRFCVDLKSSKRLLESLPQNLEEIRIGLYRETANGGMDITHQSGPIPATISQIERR